MLWGIMGDQGGPGKPRSLRPFGLKTLSVAGCTFSPPLICPADLHSTWKYIQRLVPDRWLRPRLTKHKLYMWGDNVSRQLSSLFAQWWNVLQKSTDRNTEKSLWLKQCDETHLKICARRYRSENVSKVTCRLKATKSNMMCWLQYDCTILCWSKRTRR